MNALTVDHFGRPREATRIRPDPAHGIAPKRATRIRLDHVSKTLPDHPSEMCSIRGSLWPSRDGSDRAVLDSDGATPNSICERANGAGPLLGFSTDGVVRLFAFASDGVSKDGVDQDILPAGGIGNIVLDPLGRALYPVSDGALKLTVRRNLPSGLIDKTFGVAGVAQAPASAATVVSSVVALSQLDGRILVGGHRQVVGENGLTFTRFWQ